LKTGATLDKWGEWRAKLDAYSEIVQQLARDYQAVFVPLQSAFNKAQTRADAAYWLWDGVHPTAAGHDLIACEWLSAVESSPSY
jgi:lysophospholipase L1-like esterase